MLNDDLDLDFWRRDFQARGHTQIQQVMQPVAAEAFARCLERDVPWQLAERSSGTSRTTPRGAYPEGEAYRALLDAGHARAGSEFQFAYDSYQLVNARKQGWDPELLAHLLLDFFNTPEFLEFARFISDMPDISHVNGQCTRYRPGHYLLPHEDEDVQEGRRVAYVLNLSRHWAADWGGQLQFLDATGQVTASLVPRWNSLSLLRVPQRHQVTLISPWAGQDRLAVTGWWLAR
jgi:Rps23 Pro-64 3,4-dihydroxylase Tpa1-like proline 4-hydroxylase